MKIIQESFAFGQHFIFLNVFFIVYVCLDLPTLFVAFILRKNYFWILHVPSRDTVFFNDL